MNKIKNQSGEVIVSVGSEGSHIRNKEVYNLTYKKLNNYLWDTEYNRCKPFYSDMENICDDDNIPTEITSSLISTANFYFLEEYKEAQEQRLKFDNENGIWKD